MLSHHRHSGRLLPHQHTSYLPLIMLLAVVGFVLSVCTVSADHPPPQSGSVGLTGIVPGKPPTTAATITTPTDGQHFSTSPVTIGGICPSGTLVEVYKNDIFAGSAFCDSNGKFSFDVDLLYGKNILIARVYDSLNQQGPDSTGVTVYYDASQNLPGGLAGFDFGGAQLLLNTDAVYRGVFPGTEMAMPLTILGGRAPYAVNIQWGDSGHNLIPRGDNAVFNATHTYSKPGTFQVSIQATDAAGRVAFLTVAALVNGQPDLPASTTADTPAAPNVFISIWPAYVATVGMVLAFWLGEKREKRVLAKHGQLVHPI